jgi:hypothetical protein
VDAREEGVLRVVDHLAPRRDRAGSELRHAALRPEFGVLLGPALVAGVERDGTTEERPIDLVGVVVAGLELCRDLPVLVVVDDGRERDVAAGQAVVGKAPGDADEEHVSV